MSELPSFKEGLIFNIKDGLNQENPIIISPYLPCLVKIDDIINYDKNYDCWKAYWEFWTTDGQITDPTRMTQNKIKVYSDLSFLNQKPIFLEIIKWNNGIYAFLDLTYYLKIFGTYWSMSKIVLNRCASDTLSSVEELTFHIKLDIHYPTCAYNNTNIFFPNDNNKKNYGYEIILTNPVTTIDWTYNIRGSNDELKYYEFSLYNTINNKINQCVVDTGKVYTDTSEGNGFVCNNLNDNSKYILVGYCVSQSGRRLDLPNLNIETKYTTGKIPINLTIELDKYLAENKITAEVISIVGEAKDENSISYIDAEKLNLKDNDNSVTFNYFLPTNDFLIRLWINGIKNNNDKITILKANSNTDYIELYYENGYFYVIKYSYGLTSQYMSNAINNMLDDNLNGNIYLSLLYCNGRIDIYASTY